jgi:hypothetical protein
MMGSIEKYLHNWQSGPIAAAPAPVLAPVAAPVAAPSTLAESQVRALQRFFQSCRVSKESGDEWLSSDEIAAVGDIFGRDNKLAETYLVFATSSEESVVRSWVRNQLLQRS